MKPLSVVISSYNQSETILQSVYNLQDEALSYGYEIEIIICDDGSNLYQLHILIENLKGVSCPMRLIWQKDLGFRLSYSRNNGIKLATYNTILFIDGDCIPSAGFLTAHLQQHSFFDTIICVGKRSFISSNTRERDLLLKKTNNEDYDIKQRVGSQYPWEAVIGRNFSISPISMDILFDEVMMGWGMEEIDFSINYYTKGLRNIVYCPDANVTQYHEPHKSNNPFLVKSPQNVLNSICNALWIMKKYEHDEEIYSKLAFYLFQYTIPFEFTKNNLTYDERKADYFYKNAKKIIPLRIAEIQKYHQQITTHIANIYYPNTNIQLHPYLSKPRIPDISIVVTYENLNVPIEKLLTDKHLLGRNWKPDLVFFSNRQHLDRLFKSHQQAIASKLYADNNIDMLFLYDFRRKGITSDVRCICRSKQIYTTANSTEIL
jgi:glycosyltransferase involved in cell wall biosynthesis